MNIPQNLQAYVMRKHGKPILTLKGNDIHFMIPDKANSTITFTFDLGKPQILETTAKLFKFQVPVKADVLSDYVSFELNYYARLTVDVTEKKIDIKKLWQRLKEETVEWFTSYSPGGKARGYNPLINADVDSQIKYHMYMLYQGFNFSAKYLHIDDLFDTIFDLDGDVISEEHMKIMLEACSYEHTLTHVYEEQEGKVILIRNAFVDDVKDVYGLLYDDCDDVYVKTKDHPMVDRAKLAVDMIPDVFIKEV